MAINPFEAFRPPQKRSVDFSGSGYLPFSISNGNIIPNQMINADTAIQNSDIFSVISLIASEVVSISYKFPSPYDQLYRVPNGLTNSYSFWYSVVAQMCLSGNSYVLISRDSHGLPTSLEEIPPALMTIKLGDYSRSISYIVDFDDERPRKEFKATDILHFKLNALGGLNSQYVGVSPLQSLLREINLQSLSADLSTSALKNSISPSYSITIPEATLSKDAKDHVRDSFQEQNSGKNQGKAIVLDQSATLSAMPQIDLKTAQYLNNVDWTRTQVAKAFGINDSFINGQGDQQSSLDMTMRLLITSLQRYVRPYVSEFETKFNVDVQVDETELFDPDHAQFIDLVEKLGTGSTPVLTSDEVKQALEQKEVLNLE